MTSQVYRRLLGSMPLVGSSRITTDGFPTNATATESFDTFAIYLVRPYDSYLRMVHWILSYTPRPVKVEI